MATGNTYNECGVITLFPLGVECNSTNPSYNKTDGSITLNITGGTQPYNISWSNGGNTPTITNLGNGSYTAFVVDYYGDYSATTTCVLSTETPVGCNYYTGFTMVNDFFGSNIFSFFFPTGTYNNEPYFSNFIFGWNIFFSGNSWVWSSIINGTISYLPLTGDTPITTFKDFDNEDGYTLCSDIGKPICTKYCINFGQVPSCDRNTTVLFSSSTEGLFYSIPEIFGQPGFVINLIDNEWILIAPNEQYIASLSTTSTPPISNSWTPIATTPFDSFSTSIDYCTEGSQCKCYSITATSEVSISYRDCNFSAQTFNMVEDEIVEVCLIPLILSTPYTESSSSTSYTICDIQCDQYNPSNIIYNLCVETGSVKYDFVDIGFDGNGYHVWSSQTQNTVMYYNVSLGKYVTTINSTQAQSTNSNYPPVSSTNPWSFYGGGSPNSITVTEGSCNPILISEMKLNSMKQLASTNNLSVSAKVNNTNCGCDGALILMGSDGYPPYNYSINNGVTFGKSPIFSNLCGGIYTIAIQDSSGNTSSNTVTLNNPNPKTSYKLFLNISERITNRTTTNLTKEYTVTVGTAPILPDGVTVTFDLIHSNDFKTSPSWTSATSSVSSILLSDSTPITISTTGETTGSTVNSSPGCQSEFIYNKSYTENWNSVVFTNSVNLLLTTVSSVTQNISNMCYVGRNTDTFYVANLKINGCSCCLVTT